MSEKALLQQQLDRMAELYERKMGALYALQLRWRLEAERPAFGNRDEETLLSCAKQLQAVLSGADPNDEKPETAPARCREPDCGRTMDVQAGQTEPYYCPRCWQARGSKESER